MAASPSSAQPTAGTPLTRRGLIAAGLCLCCLPSRARAGVTGPFATEEVAPGIRVRRGVDEEATAQNQGAIANVGFIIGAEAVLVTDPGGSLADGERLRATIREHTALPIRYVAMSHVHPDHLFGAGAFVPDDPTFVGHARLPGALAQRGDYYRERLEEVLGPGQAGPVVMPTMTVQGSGIEIDLGGRVVALTAHGLAHTDNDLSLTDQASGTLFPADLLFVGRVPSLDGSVIGWLEALAALKAAGAARAVPGHGPASVDWPAGAADLERYLTILRDDTRRAVAENVGIEAAVASVAASERGRWALFDDYHGHNVTKAYKELEWE